MYLEKPFIKIFTSFYNSFIDSYSKIEPVELFGVFLTVKQLF